MMKPSSLPDYIRDFKPNYYLKPVWYLPTTNRLVCGEHSAGKTTFLEMGMTELEKMGIYFDGSVKYFSGAFNEQTDSISRFALQQNTKLKSVDSWIDCDGNAFADAFFTNNNHQTATKNLKRVLEEVDEMILTVSAQRLLDIWRMKNSSSQDEKKLSNVIIAYYSEGLKLFGGFQMKTRKSLIPFRIRLWSNWHFIVTQCGDIADSEADWEELLEAVDDFTLRTNLKQICSKTLFCDSKTEPLEIMQIPFSTLGKDVSGTLIVDGCQVSKLCSAGVAMASVLGKIKLSNESFIHSSL